MALVELTIVSGFLQVLGYVVYRMKTVRPNPISWLMWAYGTGLVVCLELGYGASLNILVLPTVCFLSSLLMAFRSWRFLSIHEVDVSDWIALGVDLILTIGYGLAWYFSVHGELTLEEQETATFAFLLLSNMTTFTTFWPMVRGVWKTPSDEHYLPWVIWVGAYSALALVTIEEHGLWSVYMLYPVLNIITHLSVAILTNPVRQRRCRAASS